MRRSQLEAPLAPMGLSLPAAAGSSIASAPAEANEAAEAPPEQPRLSYRPVSAPCSLRRFATAPLAQFKGFLPSRELALTLAPAATREATIS